MYVDTVSSSGPGVANLQVFNLKKKKKKRFKIVANLVWFWPTKLCSHLRPEEQRIWGSSNKQTFHSLKNNFLYHLRGVLLDLYLLSWY